jgi:calcium-dependent protein kinase
MSNDTSNTTPTSALNPELEAPEPKLYGEVTLTEHQWGASVWEGYDKLELLADSGTGEIWLCQKKRAASKEEEEDNHTGDTHDHQQQQQTQHLYVIKAIDKNFLSGMFAKELRNEAEVLRQLDHPHIVRVYKVYEDRNNIYLVMEYCAGGGDLTTKFPYSEAQVARIMTQILSAVVYCHQHKVVHRDLKLENIVWVTDDTVKLIDFGYAQKYRRPRGDYTMKVEVGTTYTLSPQVIQGKYSERTDEWGLGVVAYMLLTGGTKPFDAEKNNQIRDEIQRGEYSMDGPEWDDISHAAKDFVSSLLEYDEDKRITAEVALESPWLQSHDKNGENVDEPVMDLVAEALITCAHEPKLKRLSMLIIAHEAPESRIEELREAFTAMDSTKDGTINWEEFQSILQNSTSFNLPKDKLAEIFDEIDMNNLGAICYTDFLSATLESIGKVDEDMVAEAFEKLDVQNSGVIDKDNIKSVLEADSKSDEAAAQAEEILNEVDAKNGKQERRCCPMHVAMQSQLESYAFSSFTPY